MTQIDEYKGARIAVVNDGKRCIGIDPDAAATEATIAVISKCPSGALRYRPQDGGHAEGAPGVNTVRVTARGPLIVHVELNIGSYLESQRQAPPLQAFQARALCGAGNAAAGPAAKRLPLPRRTEKAVRDAASDDNRIGFAAKNRLFALSLDSRRRG